MGDLVIDEAESSESSYSWFSQDDLSVLDDGDDELWVFGYGSILWKTGFEYESKLIGYIDGHVRRFWQGSIKHRGTPLLPGRVATLVPAKEGRVWGVAYQLKGTGMISKALDHLVDRECRNGGYVSVMLAFTPIQHRPSNKSSRLDAQPSFCDSSIPKSSQLTQMDSNEEKNPSDQFVFRTLAFTAMADNFLYLGPADDDRLVDDVIRCSGSCGHNIEYIIRLAEFVRENLPDEHDDHLFELERKIREKLMLKGTNVEQVIASHAPVNSAQVRRESSKG